MPFRGKTLTRICAAQLSCWRLGQKLAGSDIHQLRRARQISNGVSWHRAAEKFRVDVTLERKSHYVGLFAQETDAAQAFDAKLRQICQDPMRLKKSLNFPTEQEASYEANLSEMRSRGLKRGSANFAKEVQAHQHLQARFLQSPQASEFEIVHVPSQSRVDALYQPRWSKGSGLALQLKSSTSSSRSSSSESRCYTFQHVDGYDGMLLVLVALDHDSIWMVPGSKISQRCLRITVGSQRDEAWRVSQVGLALSDYFKDKSIPHISFQDALLQCSRQHIVEERSHSQLAALFASVGLLLHRPIGLTAAVDSILSWQGLPWRVQEKATHMNADDGKYCVSLRKHAGCLGLLAYAETDFDVLTVSLLDRSSRLTGVFLVPSFILANRKLIGRKAATLALYPPWSQPKYPAVARKQKWQLDHFVDLRSWKGPGCELDPGAKANFTQLLEKLQDAAVWGKGGLRVWNTARVIRNGRIVSRQGKRFVG